MAKIAFRMRVYKKMLQKERYPILLPRPSGTPSKIEGELGLPAPAVRAMILFEETSLNSMIHPKNIWMDFLSASQQTYVNQEIA